MTNQLKQYIDRIERLMDEKAGLQSDIKDIYAEAAGNGFDKKAMREAIKLRKLERAEREQQIADFYFQIMHDALFPTEKAAEGATVFE